MSKIHVFVVSARSGQDATETMERNVGNEGGNGLWRYFAGAICEDGQIYQREDCWFRIPHTVEELNKLFSDRAIEEIPSEIVDAVSKSIGEINADEASSLHYFFAQIRYQKHDKTNEMRSFNVFEDEHRPHVPDAFGCSHSLPACTNSKKYKQGEILKKWAVICAYNCDAHYEPY